MIHHFDFEVNENTVIRFYPRKSHVYGKGRKAPTEWSDVWETTLTYRVLFYEKEDIAPKILHEAYEEVGESLIMLRDALRALNSGVNNRAFIMPYSQPCTGWFINKWGNMDKFIISIAHGMGEPTGCSMVLDGVKLAQLEGVLNQYLTYMLNHSEPHPYSPTGGLWTELKDLTSTLFNRK